MQVGTILVYAHSYNARYPHFVRVTRMTKSTAWVEEIPKKWYEDGGYGQNGTRVPNFEAEPIPVKGSFRIKNNNHFGDYIMINRCIAITWDGTPEDEYTD